MCRKRRTEVNGRVKARVRKRKEGARRREKTCWGYGCEGPNERERVRERVSKEGEKKGGIE